MNTYNKTKIYFISQCDSGFNHVIFQHLAYPARVSKPPFSIGEPCGSGDIWTTNWTLDQWREELMAHYDFVVIADSNDVFWKRYQSLFGVVPVQKSAAFKVNKLTRKLDLLAERH